jgi:hypothetical protein
MKNEEIKARLVAENDSAEQKRSSRIAIAACGADDPLAAI